MSIPRPSVLALALAGTTLAAVGTARAADPEEMVAPKEIRLPAPPRTPVYDSGAGVTLPEMFGLARSQGAARRATCGPPSRPTRCTSAGTPRSSKRQAGKRADWATLKSAT